MAWRIRPRHRVIVDNDWAGDPDGLVALAHHLLSPTDAVVGVTSSTLNPVFGDPTGTAEEGAVRARHLMSLLGRERDVRIGAGVDTAFDGTLRASAAARLISDEALRDTELPLVVVCGGPLTNVADALAAHPEIADRMTLAWVGGTLDPGDFEYNRDTDASAAERVLSDASLEIRQYPLEVYRSLAISVAELEYGLTASGPVGRWLWQQYEDLPLPAGLEIAPMWPLGDSAPLVLTALSDATAHYTTVESRTNHHMCTRLDARLVIGDLFARLRLFEAAVARPADSSSGNRTTKEY